jgi:hypothetical protein
MIKAHIRGYKQKREREKRLLSLLFVVEVVIRWSPNCRMVKVDVVLIIDGVQYIDLTLTLMDG